MWNFSEWPEAFFKPQLGSPDSPSKSQAKYPSVPGGTIDGRGKSKGDWPIPDYDEGEEEI